jgi:hypothetical protein
MPDSKEINYGVRLIDRIYEDRFVVLQPEMAQENGASQEEKDAGGAGEKTEYENSFKLAH